MKCNNLWIPAALPVLLLLASCGTGGSNPQSNMAPSAVALMDAAFGLSPLSVEFDADGSSDPEGTALSFAWDFDGDNVPDSRSAQAGYTFTAPGSHTVRLTVEDALGLSASDTLEIVVTGSEPSGIDPPVQSLFSSTGLTPGMVDLAVVDGNPALAWSDSGAGMLRYIRATNAEGTAWGPRVTVYGMVMQPGDAVSLAVVAGRPAIALRSQDWGQVLYFRALDAAGSFWDLPVAVVDNPAAGGDLQLLVADGNPALAFVDASSEQNGNAIFLRATDAEGGSWDTAGAVQLDDATMDVDALSAATIDGQPAVAYYDGAADTVYYLQSTSAGGNWWTPIAVRQNAQSTDSLRLAEIDGRPGVAFPVFGFSGDQGNYDLSAAIGSDAFGASWNFPLAVESGELSTGSSTIELLSLGAEALIAYDRGGGLGLSRTANYPDGWITVPGLQNTLVSDVELAAVAGGFALAYWDFTTGSLKYQYFDEL
jgi:PKD repeat protein